MFLEFPQFINKRIVDWRFAHRLDCGLQQLLLLLCPNDT